MVKTDYSQVDYDIEWRNREIKGLERQVHDLSRRLESNSSQLHHHHKFLTEKGLAEEYIAWRVANRLEE